jgi:hypothetical protein
VRTMRQLRLESGPELGLACLRGRGTSAAAPPVPAVVGSDPMTAAASSAVPLVLTLTWQIGLGREVANADAPAGPAAAALGSMAGMVFGTTHLILEEEPDTLYQLVGPSSEECVLVGRILLGRRSSLDAQLPCCVGKRWDVLRRRSQAVLASGNRTGDEGTVSPFVCTVDRMPLSFLALMSPRTLHPVPGRRVVTAVAVGIASTASAWQTGPRP